MPALGGFLLALSPFEVAVDYRADSVISRGKLFVTGEEEGWGEEINRPSANARNGVQNQWCSATLPAQWPVLALSSPLQGCGSDCNDSLDTRRKSNWKRGLAVRLGLEGDSGGVIVLSNSQALIKYWKMGLCCSVLVATSPAVFWIANRVNHLKSLCFIPSQVTGQLCLLSLSFSC